MKIYFRLDSQGIIQDAKFKTFGCVSAIASSDVMCDLIKGKTIDQAAAVTNKDALAILGEIPQQKIHCSILAQEAVEAAINDYKKKQAKLARK